MAFSFDESEFEERSEAAEAALKSLEASPESAKNATAEDPELLADVDRRLETADYYRAILNHEFFDNMESPAAQIVDREIRAFVRERLEVLLGLRTPPREFKVVAPFSDEETKALKALAAKVLSKPALLAKQSPTKETASQASAKPSVLKPKPQVRKVSAPPPAPSTKPKAKPGPKPKQEAAPAPKQPAPTIDNPEVQTFVDHEGKRITLVEGEITEENGQRFMVVRNEKGTLYRKNITGQVVSPNRLPPMTAQQFSLFSQQQAEAQIAALDQTTGLAVLAALKSQ